MGLNLIGHMDQQDLRKLIGHRKRRYTLCKEFILDEVVAPPNHPLSQIPDPKVVQLQLQLNNGRLEGHTAVQSSQVGERGLGEKGGWQGLSPYVHDSSPRFFWISNNNTKIATTIQCCTIQRCLKVLLSTCYDITSYIKQFLGKILDEIWMKMHQRQ